MKYVDLSKDPAALQQLPHVFGKDSREASLSPQMQIEIDALRQVRDAIDRQTWAIEQLSKTMRDGLALLAHETPEYAGD